MSIDTTAAKSPAVPSKSDVHAALPPHVFDLDTARSLRYATSSAALTLVSGLLAWQFLPLSWAWAPAWILYAAVPGTFATGVWVIAHECGHGAFSKNKLVQDTIGYMFHTALLVPYFSWQRSHAIHHAKTNHMSQGETHVPIRAGTALGGRALARRKWLGRAGFATYNGVAHLLLGWPIYLLSGGTQGTGGRTNHLWPWKPFDNKLFPARFTRRVLVSTAGVAIMAALLVWWGWSTRPMLVVALYVGPYLVNNAWLVTYTWLHHTGRDTPHYDGDEWSYVRGAFCSIDRPYGRILDALHHHIGSTHAVHHLFARIPHYHAAEATRALQAAFPDMYRFDPTPIPVALWRVSTDCVAVTKTDGEWRYVDRV